VNETALMQIASNGPRCKGMTLSSLVKVMRDVTFFWKSSISTHTRG